MKPIVFQRMNGVAHPAFIRTEGDGAHERRRGEPAGAARRDLRRRLERAQRVAAARRSRARPESGNLGPASIANWNGRKVRQRGAAESAGGGKEGTTDRVHRTSEYARHGAPRGCLRVVERRASVNRSPCGRRTSHEGDGGTHGVVRPFLTSTYTRFFSGGQCRGEDTGRDLQWRNNRAAGVRGWLREKAVRLCGNRRRRRAPRRRGWRPLPEAEGGGRSDGDRVRDGRGPC